MVDKHLKAALIALALLTLLPATRAEAFCGFYVAGAEQSLYNNATVVALMREGTRTVLSMQNNYEGPPEDFAMVVPVPVVLQKDNVKVIKSAVFAKMDKLAAPRLVEYWEQDPCIKPTKAGIGFGSGIGGLGMRGAGRGGGGSGGLGVTIKARFDVGEYEIVILSAKNSNGLETWLRQEKYSIPNGASEALRPYIEQGMYFFVAKVNAKKVTFKNGQAQLSPLRFHYDAKTFSLPVRLGLLNARGKQDLIVHILAKNQRYEAASHKNVTIPTNLVVKNGVRKRFGEFYAALLDRTLEKNPGAVVTEYAWDAAKCDPCPGPTLDAVDLYTLGADALGESAPTGPMVGRVRTPRITVRGSLDKNIVRRVVRRHQRALNYCYERELAKNPGLSGIIDVDFIIGAKGEVLVATVSKNAMGNKGVERCVTRTVKRWMFPAPPGAGGVVKVKMPLDFGSAPAGIRGFGGSGWTLTRLHTRYDAKDLGDDLVFRKAPAIVGGRGIPSGVDGVLREEGAKESAQNSFQGRYIILNPWEGAVACKEPFRGRWGGPIEPKPSGDQPQTATKTAFAPRGKLQLGSLLTGSALASLDMTAVPESKAEPEPQPVSKPAPEAEVPAPEEAPEDAPKAAPKDPLGCGCQSPARPTTPAGFWLLMAAFAALVFRSRTQ